MSARHLTIGLNNLPILRIFIPFAAGVLAGQEWGKVMEAEFQFIFIFVTCMVFFLILRCGRMEHFTGHMLFGGLGFLLFLEMGFMTGGLTAPEAPLLPEGKVVLVRGRIKGEPQLKDNRWLVEMEMEMLGSGDSLFREKTTLGLHMRFYPDSLVPQGGEKWQLAGILYRVRNSGNAGEIDYASILGRRGYWFRFYVEENSPRNRRIESARTGRFMASSIREYLSRHWQGDPEDVALLKAICLGDRSQLTGSLRAAYSGAGGMHLLAVSGLHVGLIWWVIQHLFSFLVRMTRSELSRVIPTLFLLWFYAYTTGMSSSVTRSVTMFTLFTVGRLLHQSKHPVHTLLVAAFMMTVVMPGRLRDVGFQLSYSAVLGILTLFPLLRTLPGKHIRCRLLRWAWEASAVSLAAQLTTAPLVIYYFQQYPVYALLTNLVAIPMMGGLMALFVISVPFFLLGWLQVFWSHVLTLLAAGLNHLMEVVSEIPGALLPLAGTDRIMLLCWIGILLLAILSLKGRLRLPRYIIMCLMVFLMGHVSLKKGERRQSGEMLVAHFYNAGLLLFREGCRVDCYRWSADSSMVLSMERYVDQVWGRRDFRIRWMEMEESGVATGQVSSYYAVAKGIGMVGNDQKQGWIIRRTLTPKLLEMIRRHPGTLIMISGEPGIPAHGLKTLSIETPVILDGTCHNRYLGRMTEDNPLIHATSRQGSYRKTW